MTQGTGSDGHDPYQEKLDRYWAWIRGRAWLLALVLTVLGDLVLIALTRKVVPVLAYSPLSFLIFLFTFRLSARYGPWLTGGTQPLKRVHGKPVNHPMTRNNPHEMNRSRTGGPGSSDWESSCSFSYARLQPHFGSQGFEAIGDQRCSPGSFSV